MPPAFRHRNLWFFDDSQGFRTHEELRKEFRLWGDIYSCNGVGYQFGYGKDAHWWRQLAEPPREIGQRIFKDVPNARAIIWVDFTAGGVRF